MVLGGPIIGDASRQLIIDGVDLTQAPYYANLTADTRYWFLDGYTSTQFAVHPQRLVNTRPYLTSWIISDVIRITPPDMSRATMLNAYTKLAGVLDPNKGDRKIIHGEFPHSYFMGQLQKSSVVNETGSPATMEIQLDLACTGPSYSLTESVTRSPINSAGTNFFVYSYGDALVWPRFRLWCNRPYDGDVTIGNVTTEEQVVWNGTLESGDVLDFNLDYEYGIPYEVYLNGALSLNTVHGPAWPHIVPGYNEIYYWGPDEGELELRWRDRYLVGKLLDTPAPPTPSPVTPPAPEILTATKLNYPAVCSDGSSMHMFATGSTGNVYYKWITDDVWSGWVSLGGYPTTAPCACYSGNGNINVGVRWHDGTLYTIDSVDYGTTWGQWTRVSGGEMIAGAAPASVALEDGEIGYAVIGNDQSLWYIYRNSDKTFDSWCNLGGWLAPVAPSLVSYTEGQREVFVCGTDNSIYHIHTDSWDDNDGWSNWESISSVILDNTSPSACATSTDIIEIFVTGTDFTLWRKQYTTDGWTAWIHMSSLGYPMVSSPTITSMGSDGSFAVFGILHQDNCIYYVYWYAPDDAWLGWFKVSDLPP